MDVSGSQIQFIDISIHLVWMSYDSITLRHQLVCGTNPDWRRGEIPSQHRNRPGTWRPATTPWRIERRPASGCPLRRAFWSMRPHRGSLQSVRGGTRFDGIRCRGAGENALGESMSLCKHSEGISTSTCHFWILWQSFIAKKRKGIHSTFFYVNGCVQPWGITPNSGILGYLGSAVRIVFHVWSFGPNIWFLQPVNFWYVWQFLKALKKRYAPTTFNFLVCLFFQPLCQSYKPNRTAELYPRLLRKSFPFESPSQLLHVWNSYHYTKSHAHAYKRSIWAWLIVNHEP